MPTDSMKKYCNSFEIEEACLENEGEPWIGCHCATANVNRSIYIKPQQRLSSSHINPALENFESSAYDFFKTLILIFLIRRVGIFSP